MSLSFIPISLAIFIILSPSAGRSQETNQLPDKLALRIAEMRSLLTSADRPLAAAASDRQLTVEALIALIKDELKSGPGSPLLKAAFAELGEYGDCQDAILFLVDHIDYHDLFPSKPRPLHNYPAAKALIRAGLPSRTWLMVLGKPLSDEALHLRAYVLAKLDETSNGDPDSGRLLAIARLMRAIERVHGTVVRPELEEVKSHSLKNLRHMVSLLSDPVFFAKKPPRESAK